MLAQQVALLGLGYWTELAAPCRTHISKLCSSAFFHLHNISRICKFLSPEEIKTLVRSFITSRVDYCNSLLYGLPASQLNKVWCDLNTAARLTCCTMRFNQGIYYTTDVWATLGSVKAVPSF